MLMNREQVVEAEGRLEVSLRALKPLPPIVDTSHLKPLADLQSGEELAGEKRKGRSTRGWRRGWGEASFRFCVDSHRRAG